MGLFLGIREHAGAAFDSTTVVRVRTINFKKEEIVIDVVEKDRIDKSYTTTLVKGGASTTYRGYTIECILFQPERRRRQVRLCFNAPRAVRISRLKRRTAGPIVEHTDGTTTIACRS